jgi:pimeloyl-ACP methyl ester carboxylesterase
MTRQVKQPENKLKTTMGRVFQIIGMIAIIVILLGGIGRVYQVAAETKDTQQYRPLGKMVDVGGYRLHLHCTGEGSPTVVLESGLGEPALQWALVQERLEKITRVCSYDRAGLGWSDVGPGPRSSQQMVDELHTLLLNGGVEGPYVLVGHALGGFIVRLFAYKYPSETAGILLVASANENDIARMPPEYREMEETYLKSVRSLIRLTPFGITRIAGNTGLLSSYTNPLTKFSPGLRSKFMALTFYRTQYWVTTLAELSALNESRAQAAATGSLGDLPLVVLSGSPDVSRYPSGSPVEQIIEMFQDLQVELASLSTNSIHITCESCDQNIPTTDPEMVLDAINQALANLPR